MLHQEKGKQRDQLPGLLPMYLVLIGVILMGCHFTVVNRIPLDRATGRPLDPGPPLSIDMSDSASVNTAIRSLIGPPRFVRVMDDRPLELASEQPTNYTTAEPISSNSPPQKLLSPRSARNALIAERNSADTVIKPLLSPRSAHNALIAEYNARHPAAEPSPSTVEATQPTLNESEKTNKSEETWKCVNCNTVNPDRSNFCRGCVEAKVNKYKEWRCMECTYLNHLLVEECEMCGAKRPSDIDPDCYDSSDSEEDVSCEQLHIDSENEEIDNTCPVCMEEDRLEAPGAHECKQCKKSVCEACYQRILKSKNKSCPLCRYENYES
jgi:hypothetical protein